MPVIILATLAILLLYHQGIAVTKNIAAALFVFQPAKHADRVSMDSCTGWVRHVGRFRQSRVYEFSLDLQLSKGSVEISLLDR